jgi:hypothetical protein
MTLAANATEQQQPRLLKNLTFMKRGGKEGGGRDEG